MSRDVSAPLAALRKESSTLSLEAELRLSLELRARLPGIDSIVDDALWQACSIVTSTYADHHVR